MATLKAMKEYVGGLSQPSKMPGYSYGLPARECRIGSRLMDVEGSSCSDCYALKGFYGMYPSVVQSQYRKLESIGKPLWVEYMVKLIGHYSSEVFRWHDSGDLQSSEHLTRIVDIALALPDTKFWLPTREVNLVREWLAVPWNGLPDNLCVRMSAIMIGTKPPRYKGLEVLPTSTIHTDAAPAGKGNIACGAPKRGGECGPCRACWTSKVKNVSYEQH